MARFRKKNMEVDAVLYPGDLDVEAVIEVEDWLIPRLQSRGLALRYEGVALVLPRMLGGEITVQPGEWIVEGQFLDLYPCTHQVFSDLYEPVADG